MAPDWKHTRKKLKIKEKYLYFQAVQMLLIAIYYLSLYKQNFCFVFAS